MLLDIAAAVARRKAKKRIGTSLRATTNSWRS